MRSICLRLATGAALLVTLLAPATALAGVDPFKGSCTDPQAANSTVCQSRGATSDPLTGRDGIILRVTQIIAIMAGFAAVVVMVLGGIRYVTSGGAPDQVSQAKKTIIFAAVGLVAIALSQAFIGYIIGRI